jgi:hypothetical protein
MGVAQHGGRAESGAGEPGEDGFRAVFEVKQHAVASANAACCKPTRNPRDRFRETRVRPDLCRALEWRPDQGRMGAALSTACFYESGDVPAGKWMN